MANSGFQALGKEGYNKPNSEECNPLRPGFRPVKEQIVKITKEKQLALPFHQVRIHLKETSIYP